MAKNILVITGSARADGNGSELAKTFIAGARSSGNAVRRFDAATKIIHPCRGCENCWSKGRPCIVDDAFNSLAPYLQVSDILVLVSPLYWSGLSASIKLITEKMVAYTLPNRKKNLRIKEAILLGVGATDKVEDFDLMKAEFNRLCEVFDWKNGGVVVATGVKDPGDIDKNVALQEAENLGKAIQ
ncbi:MAG: flavodoxin family protein [Bacilli bacterium]|jgi:multimeric flavodoxin WrbA|nr:flavodoxin family protein [Bacilli bacterium]MCH4201763.1 flavodoxin family protein [Bacilli bacterium]